MSRKGWPVPWSPKDIKNYCKVHKEDSPTRLMPILHIYTDCRIGDALWLGAITRKKRSKFRSQAGCWSRKHKKQIRFALCQCPLHFIMRPVRMLRKVFRISSDRAASHLRRRTRSVKCSKNGADKQAWRIDQPTAFVKW